MGNARTTSFEEVTFFFTNIIPSYVIKIIQQKKDFLKRISLSDIALS